MKNNQKGRSMVEMLGVLAIIGVLSAAGLAGYSKAMFKYKVQKTVDIVMQIFQRYAELEMKDNLGFQGYPDMVETGLFPECERNEWNYCKLPIGSIRDDIAIENGILTNLIWIRFNDSNSCIAFMSYGWDKALPKEWFEPIGFIGIESDTIYAIYGQAVQSDGVTALSGAESRDIAEACLGSSQPEAFFAIRAGYR